MCSCVGCIALAGLCSSNASLQSLHLANNGITDKGCSVLAFAIDSKRTGLDQLDLSWNLITDEGVISMAQSMEVCGSRCAHSP